MDRYRAAVVDASLTNNPHSYQLQMIGSNQKVLELGAAVGDMTRALIAQHCEVTAVEYDQTNQEELETVTPHVVIGDLNDPKLFDQLPGPYDVVLAGDVLEHLLDPERVLRDAVKVLAPGGRVVVSLPNVAHIDVRLALLEGRFPYSPTGLLDNTHIRFFTRETIEKLVAAAGLMIIEMRKARVPAFRTELQVIPDDVSQEIVSHILADPDAETYQFVFTAVRVSGDTETRALAANYTALGEERDLWVERYKILQQQLETAGSTAPPDRLATRSTFAKVRGVVRHPSRVRTKIRDVRARASSQDQPGEPPTLPTISVIIPSYQHEAYIAEAIKSVAAQTYPNVQLVIVEDGSTDDSVAVIERTLAEVGLTDVIFVQQPNGGAHAALNRGLELSTGAYVNFLNSDDAYHPQRLERLYQFAEAGGHEFVFSEVTISASPHDVLQVAYTEWLETLDNYPSLSHALLRFNGAFTSSNFFLTTQLAQRLGFHNLVLNNDWDFLVRAIRDTEPAFLHEPLLNYRVHDSNTVRTQATIQRTMSEYREVILGYFLALRRGEVHNPAAPTPASPHFERLLDEPTQMSSKTWIFPSLRTLWRRSGIDLADAQKAMIPPEDLIRLVGSPTSEDFHHVGEEFLDYFLDFADLVPTDAVLDIGCGSGRIAIALTQYLDAEGSYAGFDVVPEAVDWCNKEIASRYPNFSFYVAEVRNSFYNADSPGGPETYRFPHDDNTFDFVFLTSVFTHMLPESMEQYIREIARVLKPGGRCLSTFFLDTPEARASLAERPQALSFDHPHGNYSVMLEDQPEFAVCYDEDYVLKLLDSVGLEVQWAPRYGSWCGRENFVSYQDLVIIQKTEPGA